jgi:putative tricarboxylic transport membrane protein
MDSLRLLADGFAVALEPANLLWVFVGALLGTAVGILPGIGPALTVALLLPVTYGLPPVSRSFRAGICTARCMEDRRRRS